MKLWIWLIMVVCSVGGRSARLQAAVFSLDIGSLGLVSGLLEVAEDQAFQTIQVSVELGGSHEYLINLPKTAVYYVRVRSADRILWQEAMFAIVEQSQDTVMPRLEWNPIPGAQTYRLWLSRPGVKARWIDTPNRMVNLSRLGAPWLIRLRAIAGPGARKNVQAVSFRMVVALRSSELPKPRTGGSEVATKFFDPAARDDDQAVYEPEDKDLLEGADGPMDFIFTSRASETLSPLLRRHQLQGWFRYLKESFQIDKLDRFAAAPSQGLGTGAAGLYYLQPQLALSGAVETHATHTLYDEGGAGAPATDQKRIRLHVALGLDLLNTNVRYADWSLYVGPVVNLLQLPLAKDEQKVVDFGLKIDLHSLSTHSHVSLLLLKSSSREWNLDGALPWSLTSWSIRPFLGLYHFDTRQSSGAVSGSFRESGLRLGIAREF